MPQGGKAEERTNRLAAQSDADCGNAFFDFVLAFLLAEFRQVLVRPGVRSDSVAGRCNLFHDFGMPPGMLADGEEDRLGALLGQCLEHGRRMSRPWTVIEGQDDLFIAEKIVGLEMLKSEAWSASRVDLDNAGNSKGVGIVAFRGSGTWPGCLRGLSPGRCGRRNRDRHGDRKSAHQSLSIRERGAFS